MNENTAANYVIGIDGLRAVAVIAVILYHMDLTGVLKGGFTGVDIFFVISGYVISKSLYHHADKKFVEFLLDFYKRRIIRILPLLIVVMTLTMLLTVMFIPQTWRSEMIQKTGLAAYFGYSNFALLWFNDGYFSPLVNFNPFLHTWSLAVEEQFYVLFPMIYFVWLKKKDSRNIKKNWQIILFPILAMFSFGYSIYATKYSQNLAYYHLPSRFWELAVGSMLFQLHSKSLFQFKSFRSANLGSSLGIALIVFSFIYADDSVFPYPWAIIPVVGTVLVISGLVNIKAGKWDIRKILETRVLKQIGDMSFSLYLWHWPIAVLLRWTMGFESMLSKVVYVSLSLVLSLVTYCMIENPIRRNRFIRNQRGWRIVVTGVLVLVFGHTISNWMIESQATLSLSVTKDCYTWNARAYDADGPDEPIIDNSKVNGRRLFAIGDSHTAAYRTMLNIVSKELDIEVYEYEEGGCGVLNLIKPMIEIEGCEEFYKNAFEDVQQNARPGDVVFLASLRMPELCNRFEAVDVDAVLNDYFSEEAQKSRNLAYQEANEVIKELEGLGVHVLIEAPLPVLLIPPFRCSDWFNNMNPIAKPGPYISRALLEKVRQPVMTSLEKLTLEHDDLYIWEPMEILCPGEIFCAYDDDGKPLFYDGDHLSAHGNRVLEPFFRKMLLEIWSQSK